MTVVEEYFEEIVKLILLMTFNGSIISLFIFALNPIIKDKLPKSFQYYMWFSVVIALMLPVSKIIKIPVLNNSAMPMKPMYDFTRWISDTAYEKPINYIFTPQNTYFPSTAVILFAFWQTGMILVLGLNIICYVSYVRRLKKHNINADRQETELLNNLLEGKSTLRLYKNSIVETPILIGFFRPAIILPDKKYEDMKLRNILLHEVTHMKRYDIFVKWLMIFAGAIHWFNPLVYFVRREINKACELACDEAVIKRFDISEMQQYGDTLIAVAADSLRRIPLSIAMFEGKKNLKERLDAIMKYKKHLKRTVVAASVILVTIVCAILGFSTLRDIEKEHNYVDNFPLPEDQRSIKRVELTKTLQNYEKMNILLVNVDYSVDLDDEVTGANIFITYKGKKPDPEIQSEIKSLASEELEVDIQNIYVDYIDYELYADNDPPTEDQRKKSIKSIELANALRNYDKKIIADAAVYLDDEITGANILITYKGKKPDPEMQSEIKALVSEELELDIQNIYVDYIDYESYFK